MGNYRKTNRDNGRKPKFDKNKLPHPHAYFTNTVGLKLKGSNTWQMAKCPFHEDKHASLSVNVSIGCFKCMACGASGGDIISFEMKHKDISFKQACINLGIWEDNQHQRGLPIWKQ